MAVVAMASQYAGVSDAVGRHLTSSRKNKEVHSLLLRGFSVFRDWPNSYYQFLEWRRKQQNHTARWGINQDFGGFFAQLKRNLPSKNFDFLRISFEEYLRTRWDGGVVFDRVLRLTKHTSRMSRYMPQSEVILELRIGEGILERLIKEGALKVVIRRSKRHKVILFDRQEVQEVKRIWETLLTTREVAGLLDVRLQTVAKLIQKGCLKPFNGAAASVYRYPKISRIELRCFIERIGNNLAEPSNNSKHDVVTFKKVIPKLLNSSLSVSDFIKAILDGEIRPCARVSGQGLSRYAFVEGHVRDYIATHRQNLKGSALTIEDLAKSLGVKHESVAHFIKRGFLLTHKIKIGNKTILLATAESVAAFNSIYVVASKLAKEVGTSAAFLVRCLKRDGFNPYSGYEVDGGGQYVYRREDLKSLNIPLVILEAQVAIPQMKVKRIVTADKAAELLRINMATLNKLISSDSIKPYSQVVAENKIRYYFKLASVEEYRDASVDRTELLSGSEVARLLNVGPDVLRTRWMYTNRIKPILLRHNGRKYYFHKKDVDNLLEFKKRTITSVEAGRILKVDRVTVYKLTVAKKIQPVSGPHVDGFGYNLYLREDVERLHEERQRRAQHVVVEASF